MRWRWFGLIVLLLACSAQAGEREVAAGSESTRGRLSATFSIVAVDPESGISGHAVASKYPAVGKVVPYVRAGVGAFCTQHYHVPKYGPRASICWAKASCPKRCWRSC